MPGVLQAPCQNYSCHVLAYLVYLSYIRGMGRLEVQEAMRKTPKLENQVEKVKSWYDSSCEEQIARRFPPGSLESDHIANGYDTPEQWKKGSPNSVTKTEHLTKEQLIKKYPLTEKEAYAIGVDPHSDQAKDAEKWAQEQADKMWYGTAGKPVTMPSTESYRMLFLDMGEIKNPSTFEWYKPTYFPNDTSQTITTSGGTTAGADYTIYDHNPGIDWWEQQRHTYPPVDFTDWYKRYHEQPIMITDSTTCGPITWHEFKEVSILHRDVTQDELILLL